MSEVRRRQRPIQEPSPGTSRTASLPKESSLSCCRCCCIFLLITAGLASVVIGAMMYPSSIDPAIVILPSLDDFEKKHDINADLRKAIQLFKYDVQGPESFAVDGEGNLYAGLSDGRIIRFTTKQFTTVTRLGKPPYNVCSQPSTEHRCGHIMGMETDPNNPSILYIADSYHGILKLDLKERGKMVSVVDSNQSIPNVPPMKLISDMAVLSNGSIFFTDASSKFGRNEVVYEVFEGQDNGKLLHYNPVDKTVQMVASGLHFPSGVCASHDESFLLVSEATRARIQKFNLKGPRAGMMVHFADNLPGFPGKITRSAQGGYWVGFHISRLHGRLDAFYQKNKIRNFLINLGLTNFILSLAKPTGMLVELDEEGDISRGLYDRGGEVISSVSEVLQVGNTLYLSSQSSEFIGMVEIAK